MITYKLLNTIKYIAISIACLLVAINRSKLLGMIGIGKKHKKIDAAEDTPYFIEYLLPMFYFAIIAHLCALFVGSKIVKGKHLY